MRFKIITTKKKSKYVVLKCGETFKKQSVIKIILIFIKKNFLFKIEFCN